jgi:hypothetical protein
MSTITGYKQDSQGTYIEKDPTARLIYSMDWSEWLPQGAVITAASYSIAARVNDANPPVKHQDGITNSGTVTFVEISQGTVGKIYTVTAQITTDSGLVDRRNFRIKIENRSL